MNTVTVTIPNEVNRSLEAQVKAGWFASVGDAVVAGAKLLVQKKQKLTVNGFTEEFEERVLESAKEPIEVSEARGVLETDKDIDNFMLMVREKAQKYKAWR